MRNRSWNLSRVGTIFLLFTVCWSLIGSSPAQVPGIINYQGRVVVNGTNFNGTGQFRFAFVDEGTNTSSLATVTANVTTGVILSYTVDNGGSGYISPPGVTITDTTGSGATATAQISPAGVVTNIVRGALGDGNYSASPTVTIEPPPPHLVYKTYWSNGIAAVSMPVSKGLYSVLLGDTSVANMAPLSSTVFTNSDVRLRVWFNDGATGFQQLTPDQRIGAVGYALTAQHAETADLLEGKRSDQLRTLVVSSQSSSTTYLSESITNYHNGHITIAVPRSGRIVVEANVRMNLTHVTGTDDYLGLNIGTTPTDVGDTYSRVDWEIPASRPTAPSSHYTFTVRRDFSVSAGSYTYYLNGRMFSGANNDDRFWYAHMLAIFYPET